MRRKDLAAGAAVFLVLAQLLFAQLTIAITGCLLIVGRVGRWRLTWLAWPAVAGIAWVLADGAAPSLAGYLASGGHLVAHLARPQGRVVGLARLRDALAGWRRWLPAQLPLAVPVAVAEAALIGLAGRRDGRVRHRPGFVAGVGRAYLAWSTGRGELATADGGCLGIAVSTGRRAAVSWQEAAGGVLCTGQDAASVTATGLALTLAAIAHRKAVLVIDLASGAPEAGRTRPADAIESACADVGARLRRFGGPHGCYDPLAGSDRRDAAQHVLAMIDWAGVGDERRRFCAEVVHAALNIAATSAAAPDRPAPSVLDELLGLLQPGALGVRAREMPGELGAVVGLADRLDADPAAVALVTAQLEELRGGALGRWLRRARGDSRISLRRALADREVVLFSLDAASNGWPAGMIARLALADADAILAEFAGLGEPTDCLVWVNGCEFVTPAQLRALMAVGASAGAAVLLGTAADSAAATLASEVNVVAIRGHAPPSLRADGRAAVGGTAIGGAATGRASEAGESGTRAFPVWATPVWASSGRAREAVAHGQPRGLQPAYPPGSTERVPLRMKEDPALPQWLTAGQHRDALSLLVRGPRPRALADCRAIR